jgi:16S rRNA (cytosine1402-N4)-methyltransferase
MLSESVDALQVVPGGRYCDATLGAAGHARALLERSAPDGRLVGLDRDPEALRRCEEDLAPFRDRVTLCQGNFADVVEILTRLGMIPVDGVLLDLGVSSCQLGAAHRGFSFSSDGPLDMRMDPTQGRTAAELIADLSERDLAHLIRTFGEDPSSRRIARAIKRALREGTLDGTRALARVVATAVGPSTSRGSGHLHPATRTFMALRMAVNDELGALGRFLETFTETLRPGGRVALIAFHSLEDRAVKEGFSRLAKTCTCPPGLPVCACGWRPLLRVLTRRPLRPRAEEVIANPRSRSARLRVAERL